MKNIDVEQLEKLMKTLPKFERSKKADALFYKKLEKLAEEKFFEENFEQAPVAAKSWFSLPRFAFASAFAVLLIATGVTFAVYQPSVTYGTSFYTLKKTGEKVELAFAFNAEQKVNTHVRFADRRLEEADNIIAKNPQLAWLLNAAKAAEDNEVALDSKAQEALEKTLEDMKQEIAKASEIVETKISAPEKVERALGRIERSTDRQIERLMKFKEKVRAKRARELEQMMQRVANEQDERLASLIEAREQAKEALEKREKTIHIQLLRREKIKEKIVEEIQERRQQAKEELEETVRLFEAMPSEQREIIKDSIEQRIKEAREALNADKIGRTEGIARATRHRLEVLLPLPQPGPAQEQPSPLAQPAKPSPAQPNPEIQPQQPQQPQPKPKKPEPETSLLPQPDPAQEQPSPSAKPAKPGPAQPQPSPSAQPNPEIQPQQLIDLDKFKNLQDLDKPPPLSQQQPFQPLLLLQPSQPDRKVMPEKSR